MGINEVLFRETEDRIRNYYRKDKRIKNIKENIKFLEDGIESEEALRLSQELDILVFQEQEKKIG